jgi:hypothetical protein
MQSTGRKGPHEKGGIHGESGKDADVGELTADVFMRVYSYLKLTFNFSQQSYFVCMAQGKANVHNLVYTIEFTFSPKKFMKPVK